VICDASILPYPKHIIKMVLLGCMDRAASNEDTVLMLKAAYVGLADFQENLSPQEREAVTLWAQSAEARETGGVPPHLTVPVIKAFEAVTMRVYDECLQLAKELKEPRNRP
jgi:hypothetical protein